jgi:hypothetical protein
MLKVALKALPSAEWQDMWQVIMASPGQRLGVPWTPSGQGKAKGSGPSRRGGPEQCSASCRVRACHPGE